MVGIIILCLLVLFFFLNFFYLEMVDKESKDKLILRGKNGNWDFVAIGSTYGRFGVDFQKIGVNGWNFCYAPQFLYYTDKILRQYCSTFKSGCVVVIVLPDLVFASGGKSDYQGADRYRRILERKYLGDDYSFKKKLCTFIPLIRKNSIKKFAKYLAGKRDSNIFEESRNRYNIEESVAVAKERCVEWCQKFGFQDTKSDIIPDRLHSEFEKSTAILQGMIKFSLSNGFRPVLVVPPLSFQLNEMTSSFFFKKILYDNIKRANIYNIPFLDYREDKRFQDWDLYLNSDFLNATGRTKFTEVLVKDIKRIFN